MSHMLLIGGRTPYKILFARASGKTFQVGGPGTAHKHLMRTLVTPSMDRHRVGAQACAECPAVLVFPAAGSQRWLGGAHLVPDGVPWLPTYPPKSQAGYLYIRQY